MSKRKGRKDAAELDAAADAPLADDAGAAVAAADAAAGPAGEAGSGDPQAANALEADAEDAGHLQGTPDPVADAIDAEGDEPETEEAVSDGEEAGEAPAAGADGAGEGQRDPDGEEPAQTPAADGGDAEGDQDAAGDVEHRHEPAAYESYAAIIGVEFADITFTVTLADGCTFTVRYEDVDFLADASLDSHPHISHVEIVPYRVFWPAVERGLTTDRIHQLAIKSRGPLAHERIAVDMAQPAPRELEANVVAALASASVAYGTSKENGEAPCLSTSWLTAGFDVARQHAEAAAAFLRKSRGAQPETLVLHLGRSGFGGAPAAEGRVSVAWKVFAFTLAELDALDQRQEEERQAAAAAEQARKGPAPMPRSELSFVPPDRNPLTELGRRIQRNVVK